ncbi:MAG: hypothetical protein QNK04_26985 [Myxococcota bacterium]|nr:hypothetical protein [Myxococcota bacterium]
MRSPTRSARCATAARATLAAAGLSAALGCATPLEQGEALYRDGDHLGALEQWRSVSPGSEGYERARKRIAELEPEFDRLAVEYRESAQRYERQDRLAEAILDARLALQLEPDPETLAHVQQLARTLAARKADLGERYRKAFDGGDLASARTTLTTLRRLDPFDAALESESRVLDEALRNAVGNRMAAGRRAFAAGRHKTAAREFRRVLTLEPGNESARGYLSYIATMRRETESVGGRPAPFAAPGSEVSDASVRAEGFHQSSLAAERRGEPYAAIRYELRALETDPEHAGARRHLKALRGRLSGEVEALVEAGRIAFREEELQSALALWRRAVLIDPDNERVLAYIGRAEQQLENLERLRATRDGT